MLCHCEPVRKLEWQSVSQINDLSVLPRAVARATFAKAEMPRTKTCTSQCRDTAPAVSGHPRTGAPTLLPRNDREASINALSLRDQFANWRGNLKNKKEIPTAASGFGMTEELQSCSVIARPVRRLVVAISNQNSKITEKGGHTEWTLIAETNAYSGQLL